MTNRGSCVAMMATTLVLVVGCTSSDPTQHDQARAIAADTTLSDTEAISQLADLLFQLESKNVSTSEDGSVALDVVVRGRDEARFKILDLDGGPDAAQLHANVELGLVGLALRNMIEHGGQRNLSVVTVTLRTVALNETGGEQWYDTFQCRLSRQDFDQFMESVSGLEYIRDPKTAFALSTEINYDHFGSFVAEEVVDE